MAWLYLCIAGVMEVFWSTCMKFSHGFTDLKFSVLTIVGMIVSFAFLSQATKVLPLGTAYAVWTGIGALGALIAGIVRRHRPVQGTGRPRPALLRRPAPGGHPGPEGHVRALSGPLPSKKGHDIGRVLFCRRDG